MAASFIAPRVLHLSRRCHPGRATHGIGRRQFGGDLAALSAELQIPLVEDLALAEMSLVRESPPPIAAFSRDGPILTIGSFSKVFWSGLRLGWIRGPEDLIARLSRWKALADLGSPWHTQAMALRLLAETAVVQEERRRDSAGELTQVARRQGVAIVPGSATSPEHRFADPVRLPFVADAPTVQEGISRLARVPANPGSEERALRGHRVEGEPTSRIMATRGTSSVPLRRSSRRMRARRGDRWGSSTILKPNRA